MDEIEACVAYDIDGQIVTDFPTSIPALTILNIQSNGKSIYQSCWLWISATRWFRWPSICRRPCEFEQGSERKDEVFAKKGKFEADEIPAATQIFTPNWIVKYMVQNTVGRIYLDNNPYETQLQKKWQYLVEPSEKPSTDTILKYKKFIG